MHLTSLLSTKRSLGSSRAAKAFQHSNHKKGILGTAALVAGSVAAGSYFLRRSRTQAQGTMKERTKTRTISLFNRKPARRRR